MLGMFVAKQKLTDLIKLFLIIKITWTRNNDNDNDNDKLAYGSVSLFLNVDIDDENTMNIILFEYVLKIRHEKKKKQSP